MDFPDPHKTDHWSAVDSSYRRATGLAKLGSHNFIDEDIHEYLLTANVPDTLAFIEHIFQYFERIWADWFTPEIGANSGRWYTHPNPAELVSRLNSYFTQHRIGYRYLNGHVVRRDEEYSYSQMIEPAMTLLLDHDFKGAAEEFSSAHDHYLHGRTKECITDCAKSCESTMKSICDKRERVFDKTATAKTLIDILLKNGLIPKAQASFNNSLRSLLESGLPPLRNKESAHGQGTAVTSVAPYVAQFAINLTAANILFLIQADDAASST